MIARAAGLLLAGSASLLLSAAPGSRALRRHAHGPNRNRGSVRPASGLPVSSVQREAGRSSVCTPTAATAACAAAAGASIPAGTTTTRMRIATCPEIIAELTNIYTTLDEYGGNILTFDDPRLLQFPIAYVSEPGQWNATDERGEGLREYLLKGGFVIFDDFGSRGYRDDMCNLANQMKRALPGLDWMPLDGSEAIWDSFFTIEQEEIVFTGPAAYRGPTPEFFGLFLDNDRKKRMIAIAGNNGDIGEFWEYSDKGWYPVDLSNEAYKVGINYVMYPYTH